MNPNNQEDRRKMDEILKISSIFSENKENTLVEILQTACFLLGVESGSISNVNGNIYVVHEFFSTVGVDSLKGLKLNKQDTFCDFTLEKNRVVAIDDVAASEYKIHPAHTTFKVNAYIGVPIKFNEHEIGTLSFTSHHAKNPPFTQSDRDLVQYLGQWISNHLDRLYYKENINLKNEELAEKNENLQKIMQEKNQLFQILVHDLKSPLSNIKMLSFLFQDFVKDKESEELLEIFNKSLQDAFHLIEQMETLNTVENYNLSNYIEEFDLNDFLIETVKAFSNTAEAKQIKLNYEATVNSSKISTDQNFLKRILHNLISNAIKFSPFDKKIQINLKQSEQEFIIEVIDEGPGISDEEQKKLFNRFSILSNKPTNNESSSGLGLFIVKELLKKINGEITANSIVGKGSNFSVRLPIVLNNVS
ncbi:GAF domain-containing sensor histidine kinase [Pelobium sp.]|nr:GAF domain-containing sensor histidine kinase [Pelobium sp.]MDA9555126.1 GAF domain-containing sensor histidine kinase [Pelobium sp.]